MNSNLNIVTTQKKYKYMNEIAFKAMLGYAIKLKSLEKIVEKSEFTENDAMQMDKKVKKSLKKHYENN